MDRRVEIVIEGRVSASVDQAAVEEAKRKAAEVEVAAREAGEALSGLPEEVAERVAEAARVVGRLEEALARLPERVAEAARRLAGLEGHIAPPSAPSGPPRVEAPLAPPPAGQERQEPLPPPREEPRPHAPPREEPRPPREEVIRRVVEERREPPAPGKEVRLSPEDLRRLREEGTDPLQAAYARALGMDHPMYRRVLRGLEGVEAQAAGARTASDYARLEGRLATLDRYLEIALAQGADPKAADRLREEMARLREEIARQREARERARLSGGGSGGGGGTPPGGSPPPGDEEGDGGGGLFGEVLEWGRGAWRRAAMGGLSRLGPLGTVLARLGPWGMAAGALIAIPGAISLGARLLEGLNREARNEVEGAADLARLLEYDRNPLALFRRPGTLLPDDRLLALGYTTRDAQRIAALYNLPGGVQGDVRSILAFARTTGIGEEGAARAARELGLLGIDRGQAGQALEVLKAAMAEGVREGVDKASTLQGLLQVTRENAARGVSLTPTGLAFQASLQAALAGTGNRLLQGEMGARAQASLQEAFSGAGDPGLQMFLVNVLGGLPSAKELGLSGAEARGYERLRQADPGRAMEIALRLLPQRNPAMWARMVAQAEAQLGVGLTTELLRSVGIEGEALLTLLGTGVGQVAERAARRTGAMRQDLLEDVQGRNTLYWEGVQLRGKAQAVQEAEELLRLGITGGVEREIREKAADFSGWMRERVEGLAPRVKRDILDGSSRRGRAGEGSGVGLPGEEREAPPPRTPSPEGHTPGGVADEVARYRAWQAVAAALGGRITLVPGEAYPEAVRRRFPGLPERHMGLDVVYGDPRKGGDPVRSPFAGRVVDVGEHPQYGNYIVLDVGDGIQVKAAHLQAFGVGMRPGREVKPGDVLGLEGATGAATGPHTHWELRRDGRPVADPDKFLQLWERLTREKPEGSRSGGTSTGELRIRIEGDGRLRLEGVPDPARRREAEAALNRGLAEALEVVHRPPENWKGG